MTGLIKDFLSYLSKRLQRYRNYPFLQATMAACALVDAADGEVTYLERVRVDQLLETLEELQVFDPHEGVELFNGFVDDIKANPQDGHNSALEVVLAETGKHPEKGELLVRVCVAVSEINGEIPIPDQVEIVRLCSELGVEPGDCGLYTDSGSLLLRA
jgi:tellurite resistance protein TerB